jgi:hypothetical protein
VVNSELYSSRNLRARLGRRRGSARHRVKAGGLPEARSTGATLPLGSGALRTSRSIATPNLPVQILGCAAGAVGWAGQRPT